jgi:hypothetical protein
VIHFDTAATRCHKSPVMRMRPLLRGASLFIAIAASFVAMSAVEGGDIAQAASSTNPDTFNFIADEMGFQTDQNLFVNDNGGEVTWGGYAPCQFTSASVDLSNGVHENFGPSSTGTTAPGGVGITALSVTGVHCTNIVGAMGIAALPSGAGYYVIQNTGSHLSYGNVAYPSALISSSIGYMPLHIVAATETSGTNNAEGLLLVNLQGGVRVVGGARFYGSIATPLNAPIVGIAMTPDGGGYWMVASDGGVFAFGDAKFFGSMGAVRLNQPIVGMAADDATGGYWLVAADGGVFSFNAPFYGSTGNIKLNKPIVAMEAAPSGAGYRFVASDGGVFDFNLPFEGSLGRASVSSPVVGMAPYGTDGYWLVEHNDDVQPFGTAPTYAQETMVPIS